MNEAFYSEEDFRPSSPGLERVYPKAAPSPSPPPVITKSFHPPVSPPSSSPSRRQKKTNRRRKTRPTQGDWVLIREMAPNQPEIAHQVSQQALNSDSDTGVEDEDDMEDQLSTTATTTSIPDATPLVRLGAQPFSMQPGKDSFCVPGQPTATSSHRDSVVEPDFRAGTFMSDRRASDVSHRGSLSNGVRQNTGDAKVISGVNLAIHSASPANPSSQRRHSTAIPHPQEELATNLHQLQIPESDNRLPIIQPQTPLNDAPSPATQQSLPPISHITSDIPRSASVSEDIRANGLVHRQSISSLTQSPTSRVRQMSISSHAHTPVSPFPLSASSPISASSDMFLRSGSGHVFDNRRPSQVTSENGRYPPTLHSASTSEGYQSSEGLSPGSQQTPVENLQRHMSLDGTLATSAIILPPPNGSGIQNLGQHSIGTFGCDYPGCNALPFQTQYLLK
jgi:hypothetical protein